MNDLAQGNFVFKRKVEKIGNMVNILVIIFLKMCLREILHINSQTSMVVDLDHGTVYIKADVSWWTAENFSLSDLEVGMTEVMPEISWNKEKENSSSVP